MLEYSSIATILIGNKHIDDKGITFVEGGEKEVFLSYKALFTAALAALDQLQKKGLKPKDELVFQLDDNQSFIVIFWACILGGIIPVPISIGNNEEHKTKFFNVWKILSYPWLITAVKNLEGLETFATTAGFETDYKVMKTRSVYVDDLTFNEGIPEIYKSQKEDIAFIQFSSGSTGSPKGVILTHMNLIANMEAIGTAAGYLEKDSMISWMPLTHDMGLIGFHLNPLYYGMNQYLMPTALFIRRPSLWISKASEYKVTVLCSPNFGYKYLMTHCDLSIQPDWELSNVRMLYNGAEPISLQICREFNLRMLPYGLKDVAMCPVYGLAEASLAVSMSGLTEEIKWLTVDRESTGFADRIILTATAKHCIDFVNVGKPVKYCSVGIAGEDGELFPEEMIGQVIIKGINVTSGYYNNEAKIKESITADGWLKTGDLGFLKDGDLYITGRIKDIFFNNGQNFYPYDIERAAEEVEGISLNKIVVGGYHNDLSGKEEVIAFVFHRGDPSGFIPVMKSLKAVIGRKTGLELDKVIPVRNIPRTTSGKLQRFSLLAHYKSGEFQEIENKLKKLLDIDEEKTSKNITIPENDIEIRLLAIWKKVLKSTLIGVTHNFFQEGGNSLKVMEMSMHIHKEFEVELPLATFYEKQTICELSKEIPKLRKKKSIVIPKITGKDEYPLSSTQRGIYYNWELDKTSVAYNIPLAFGLGEAIIDLEKFEYCINQLLQQYDSFRTTFHLRENPVAKLENSFPFSLFVETCADAEIAAVLKAEVKPFDLSKGPLFRIKLFKTEKQIYLFIDFHHIISDGLSIYDFLYKLLLLYKEESIEFPQTSYGDYAYWEPTYFKSEEVVRQEQFWKQKLGTQLPLLALPIDFQRPAMFDYQGKKLNFVLNKGIVKRLNELAKANDTTLHVLLFSIYNLLLSKYTGQNDMVIGIPVAGRIHPSLQEVQGMFVNKLAILTHLEGESRFLDLLKMNQAHIAAALQHQGYPFESLAAHYTQQRNMGRNPVFDTMFVYQNMGVPYLENCEINFREYFFDPGFAKFDLSLEVFEHTNAVHYNIEYATALFKEETIVRLAKHFTNLIDHILENPAEKLSDLPCISKEEYKAAVLDFNATQSDFPDATIHELFEQQVVKNPHHIALTYGTHEITYEELDHKANLLASLLIEKGLVPESITGILLERSPALIIGILAVLKAGGAYLPIDSQLPEDRIKYLLADCKAQILLIDLNYEALALTLEQESPSLVLINIDLLNTFSPNLKTNSCYKAVPNSLAYIIYTSGTTGMPKGVMIEHKSLVNYTCWAAEQYLPEGKSAFALHTSISFDLTITSIFTPLITGNTIVIYNEENTIVLIERIVNDNKAEVIKLTPSHLKILSSSDIVVPLHQLKLKTLIVGGEQLTTELAKTIDDRFKGKVAIYNEYGPTEATVGCMIHKFQPEMEFENVPVGVPAANTKIYLFDQYMQPVPLGVQGNLYIAGDGMARGYLFREEETSRKFITNPHNNEERLYKTGDLARRLSNGSIEYTGRSDQQLKLNGYRIEPGEIVHQLMAFAGITDVLIAVRTTQSGNNLLCAYYTGQILTAALLRDYLVQKLPYFMIPAHYVHIAQLPLTTNGKVDYNALPEIETEREPDRGPANRIEATSLKIWTDVLNVVHISLTDNFFELGGDSIKAVQIAARLFEQGVLLKAKDILRYQTIAQIGLHATTGDLENRYEQGTVLGEKMKSPIDSWFFSQNFYNPNYYTQSVLLDLKRKINISLLEQAVKMLIAHHDGLRINYDANNSRLLIKNTDHINDFKITQVDKDFTDYESLFSGLKSEFDISKGLLLKIAWIKDNAQHTNGCLFITMHHLVIDGVSWRIFLEDLYNLYQTIEKGDPFKLPLKTASLLDHSKRLKAYDIPEAEKQYWQNIDKLNFHLPLDYATDNWQAKYQHKLIDTLNVTDTTFLLKGAHHAYKTDIPILLNTALAIALKEWTNQSQFVIEQEGHGREFEDMDTARTIGWFTTMYPVSLNLDGVGIRASIEAVKEQLRRIPNKGIGFGILKYDQGLLLKTNIQDLPRTQVRFNYLGQFNEELSNDLFAYNNRSTGSENDLENHMTAVLELNIMMIDNQLQLELAYNTNAHASTTMEWFKERFMANLVLILDHIREEKEVHFTLSDFDEADLDYGDLDVLFTS